MGLFVGLVVIVGRSRVVQVVETMVVRVVRVVRVVAPRIVPMVDTTVVIGHRRVGTVELLETAGVFISSQDTVLSST